MKRIFARVSYMSVFMAIVAFISMIISILDMLFYLNLSQFTRIIIAAILTIYLQRQNIIYIGYGPWG